METSVSTTAVARVNEPVSVLIVEDESIIAMEMEARLAAMGYRVIGCAASADAALEMIQGDKPDIVLMDINIQGETDGVMLARKIREDEDIPSIFLTAYSDDLTISRAVGSSPVGYLTKPFSDREVKAAIEVGLYKEEKEKELKRQKAELERANKKLQEALNNIKVLRGLLPICAWCKSVRDDDGYWQEVSAYIAKNSHAEITHSICPSCAKGKFEN